MDGMDKVRTKYGLPYNENTITIDLIIIKVWKVWNI